MVLGPEPVLDLRHRGQDEAVPVLDRATARRQQPADQSLRSRLAHVLGFHAVAPAAHERANLVGRAGATKEPAVEERRVWDVERVLDRGMYRRLHVEHVLDRGVAGRAAQRQWHRLAGGRGVRRREYPDEAVALERRKRRCAASRRVAVVTQARNGAALPRGVELPAVIGALEPPGRQHAAERQRHVAVRTAVEQRRRALALAAEQHERHAEQRARERAAPQLARSTGHVPPARGPGHRHVALGGRRRETRLDQRVFPMKSWTTCTSSAGASSWRKWPAFAIVTCGCPLAPGIRSWKTRSPPLVIGSASLKAVRNGLVKRSSTRHAASFSATEACCG